MDEVVIVGAGDRPFASIDDVISPAEPRAMSEQYKTVAGDQRKALER